MKMPAAHIWKTAVEATRGKIDCRRNLHIGKTMRDLYISNSVERSAKLEDLLEELRKREAMAKKKID